MHFAERFFNIFHHTLLTASDTGPDRRPWPEVAAKVDGLLGEERALSLPPDFSERDHLEALMPVILWIDERLLTSERPDAAQWYDHSLQRRLFSTNLGGEIFFRRLAELLLARYPTLNPGPPPAGADLPGQIADLWIRPGLGQDPAESVIDVYALALLLGYRGLLTNAPDDAARRLRDLAAAQIRGWREGPPAPDPKPSRGAARRLVDDWGWTLSHVLVPLAALAILYLRRSEVIASLPF
jgi:hypothetical protein